MGPFEIKTEGFDSKSKLSIAKDYLVPRLLKDYNINNDDVTFSEDTIHTLIDHYTNKEKGVRNLKRCLETIISKINVLQYLIAAENKIEKPLYGDPEKVKKDKVNKVAKKNKKDKVKIGISLNITEKDKKRKSSSLKDKSKNKKHKKIAKVKRQTYIEYGRDVHDLSGSDLEEFADRNIRDNKKSQLKTKNKVKKFKIVKNYKQKESKKKAKKVIVKKEILEDIKVSDIVKFNVKNFKMPIKITNDMIKIFIKKQNTNPSIEHLYM